MDAAPRFSLDQKATYLALEITNDKSRFRQRIEEPSNV